MQTRIKALALLCFFCAQRNNNTPPIRWYIGECKPTRERTLRSAIEKAGYEVYVASQKRTVVYASRNRRVVESIVIPGLVFIRTTEDHLMNILLDFSGIYRFMLNRLASDKASGKRVYAYLTDDDIEKLREVLDNADTPVMVTTEKLSLGQEIEIVRGPLAGIKGELARINGAAYLVLKIEMGISHYVLTEINVQDTKPVKNEE